MNDINEIVRFELFRYQLLPLTRNVQPDMFVTGEFQDIDSVDELRDRKNSILERVLSDFPVLQHRDNPVNHRVDLDDSPWFVVEINTRKLLQREKKDFEKERLDTWPHVVVIINNDPGQQFLAISKNSRAFSSGAVVANMLQTNLNKILEPYFLSIHIEALFDKEDFWELVSKYRGKIQSVNFELISPNMANISKTLKIDLNALNAATNSHETDLKLNATKGSSLEISDEDSIITGLVDYASEGGGDIEIQVNGLKKKLRTSKNVKELSIDELSVKNLTPERLRWLFEQLK